MLYMQEKKLNVETGGPKQWSQKIKQHGGGAAVYYSHFIDLLKKMLTYSPELRIKPDEALKHPFMTEQHGKTRGDTQDSNSQIGGSDLVIPLKVQKATLHSK